MTQPLDPSPHAAHDLPPGTRVAFDDAINRIRYRVEVTLADGRPGFPHYAESKFGTWTRSPAGDWTGGFWVGELWLLARVTGEAHLLDAAHDWSRRLEDRVEDDTIFRGFLFWYGSALGSLLLDDSEAANRAVSAGRALDRSFNRAAGLMPLGNSAEEASDVGPEATNIDGVPGATPLLAWAGARTRDDGLRIDAQRHAHQHAALCVRDDGSVCQSAIFDPATGHLVRRYTHKGFSDQSTWARAQTWAMLGFAQAARWTDYEIFLPIARTVADWYVDHLPPDGVTYWDFDAPQVRSTGLDTSAASIGAASLLKLAALDPTRSEGYLHTAVRSLTSLTTAHLTPIGDGILPPGMLLHGCYNHRIDLAVDHELIWGDYFLLEALLAVTGRLDTSEL
jgi:unsaturated chondroitin disaccharide hydrolase